MLANRLKIVLITFFAVLGCKENSQAIPKENFKPLLMAIMVNNIEKSIIWYSEKLDFKIEKEITEYPDYGLKLAFLKNDDFHLELIEKDNTYVSSEILNNNEQYLGGVFKIGFSLKNLESKFEQLKQMTNVNFVANLGDLPESKLPIKWPKNTF